MRNPLKSDASASLGLLLARLPIAAMFLLAGIAKMRAGIDHFVKTAEGGIPAQAPHEVAITYLHLVPWIEVGIGTLLAVGLLTRLAGLVGALMVITFIVGATGVVNNGLPQSTVIYVGLLLALFLVGPGRFSLDAVLVGRRARAAAIP